MFSRKSIGKERHTRFDDFEVKQSWERVSDSHVNNEQVPWDSIQIKSRRLQQPWSRIEGQLTLESNIPFSESKQHIEKNIPMNSMRFRRSSTASQERAVPRVGRGAELLNAFSRVDLSDTATDPDSEEENRDGSNRRRRRNRKAKTADEQAEIDKQSSERILRKKKKEKPIFEDELDPYDSDPGESYRQHCMKIQGVSTKSCLRFPVMLKSASKSNNFDTDEPTESSLPPSPLGSETEDLLNQTPVSLPPDTARLRYSLRSAIGDGSAKQPTGPSVMDRRELRPNGVALNVSHWSDTGSRAYMEDR